MIQDRDHYEAYYANKLWNLMPAVYRALDTDQFNSFGPLRELINRIGAQAAILRRSMDRMWQDQSIETCDDWVIPYIGDLLATNLVVNLDATGQRLDVAKTIYYRRRKGTMAVLEEIAADITGWDAKVVEFFRRMGRTRHGLDPAIGLPLQPGDAIAQLQQAEGLIGPVTRTPIGGTARLCNVNGAINSRSAFDEFFHTADFRYGQGMVGWHNIPRLGVFLWRLMSFETGPVTPVHVQGCPGWFTFDPTGRDIPLFAVSVRDSDYYATQWVSPTESQLPGPISQPMFDAAKSSSLLYPDAMSVYTTPTPQSAQAAVPFGELLVRPARGRFQTLMSPPEKVWVDYAYGFAAMTGAGPYDRRLVRTQPAQTGLSSNFSGGGHCPIPPSGTFTLDDSLTYQTPNDVSMSGDLTVMAADEERPLLRFSPKDGRKEWKITGQPGTNLALDGLFVSGFDIVLRGTFNSVTITCCTFDPGSAADTAPAVFAVSADGRDLVPSRIWIEGSIATLTVKRSAMGPIRTRGEGEVDNLCMTDSIVQGIRTSGWGRFENKDMKDPSRLEKILNAAKDPVSQHLAGLPVPAFQQWLQSLAGSPPGESTAASLGPLVDALNALRSWGKSLYNHHAFAHVPLSQTTRQLKMQAPFSPSVVPKLNRSLLEDAYPVELADAALALSDGDVSLKRCTVLDRLSVHRLEASDCILNDLAAVDDTQHGCVRFSCLTTHSAIPRQFESVRTSPGANLFTSTDFGQPGYGQLVQTADARIIIPADATTATAAPPSILSGAENGSEMGAFCLAQNSIKEKALLIKYQEYMPFGLVPVLIYVT